MHTHTSHTHARIRITAHYWHGNAIHKVSDISTLVSNGTQLHTFPLQAEEEREEEKEKRRRIKNKIKKKKKKKNIKQKKK